MNTQQLKNFVKGIVRENIENKIFREILQEVSPPGKKSERMIQHVKSSLRKSHPNWGEDKITSVAIATAWKARNKGSVEEAGVDEAGLTSEKKSIGKKFKEKLEEAGYKIVAPHSYTDAKEDKARTIQTDPKVNEASYKVVSPTQVQVQKDDQARRVQTEPNVDESAYKVQKRSYQTVQDIGQNPENPADPDVPFQP